MKKDEGTQAAQNGNRRKKNKETVETRLKYIKIHETFRCLTTPLLTAKSCKVQKIKKKLKSKETSSVLHSDE